MFRFFTKMQIYKRFTVTCVSNAIIIYILNILYSSVNLIVLEYYKKMIYEKAVTEPNG